MKLNSNLMNQNSTETTTKRNEFGRFLIFSLLGIFLFYNGLMLFLKHSDFNYKFSIDQPTVFFAFLVMAYLGYISFKKTFDFWPIYKVITIGLYGLIFYLALVTCHKSMIPCLFYIPVLLMTLMQTSIKNAMFFSLITLILCYFTPHISQGLDMAHPEVITEQAAKTLKYLMYIILVMVAYLSFLVLYFYNELNKIENKSMSMEQLYNVLAEPATETFSASEQLYLKILDYMEIKKPYTSPEFTIKILAKRVKSNAAYVSRALNQEGGKKFADFVQEYRIKHVQELISNNEGEIKLEVIYKKAGFTHQSTFNRKFKEITGLTPSKYIEALKKTKNM